MRFAFIIALVIFGSTATAQSNLWTHVPIQPAPQHLSTARLSASQLKSVANVVRKSAEVELDAGAEQFSIQAIPLSTSQKVLLVESTGSGAPNVAMWLIRLNGSAPVPLAAPKDEFNGWLYSIQPSISNGYRDIVLGWHLGASETDLSYFRFDGKRYRRIGSASRLVDDQNEKVTIVPNRR